MKVVVVMKDLARISFLEMFSSPNEQLCRITVSNESGIGFENTFYVILYSLPL